MSTGFASDEEAYAAAEETVREYLEAQNLRYEGRVGTDPTRFLTPKGAAAYNDAISKLAGEGKSLSGRAKILDLAIESGNTQGVFVQVCLDQTSLRQVDPSGADVTPPERANVPALRYTLVPDLNRMLIDDTVQIADSC